MNWELIIVAAWTLGCVGAARLGYWIGVRDTRKAWTINIYHGSDVTIPEGANIEKVCVYGGTVTFPAGRSITDTDGYSPGPMMLENLFISGGNVGSSHGPIETGNLS